jgi:hypothetical protein
VDLRFLWKDAALDHSSLHAYGFAVWRDMPHMKLEACGGVLLLISGCLEGAANVQHEQTVCLNGCGWQHAGIAMSKA